MSKITLICLFLLLVILVSCMDSGKVILSYNSESPVVSYGISKLARDLSSNGYKVLEDNKSDISTIPSICVISPSSDMTGKSQEILTANSLDDLHPDGYQILKVEKDIFILGNTDRGCLYGIKDLQEQIRLNPDLTTIEEGVKKPALQAGAGY